MWPANSRLMGADEEGTARTVHSHCRQLVDPKIRSIAGERENTGDGMLVEFSSVVDAVRCAVEVQREMVDRNIETPDDMRITFRVGVNLGDVIVGDDDIYGDGVNVAARLEALAEQAGSASAGWLRDEGTRQADLCVEDNGEQSVKTSLAPCAPTQ